MNVIHYKNESLSRSIFEVKSYGCQDKLLKVKSAFVDIVKNDESYSKHFLDDSLSSLQPDIIRDCDCLYGKTLLIIKYDHFSDYAELIPKIEGLVLETFQ